MVLDEVTYSDHFRRKSPAALCSIFTWTTARSFGSTTRKLPAPHVGVGNKIYTDVSGNSHEAAWEGVNTNLASRLVVGTNTFAVMVLNAGLANSDLSFNLELKMTDASSALPSPTPGCTNSAGQFSRPRISPALLPYMVSLT
jgi:hypothetical protein